MEYVLCKPMTLKGLRLALNKLESALESHGSEVYESARTGVHVHVNVQEMSPRQLFTFITSYLVLEEVLTRFCGKDREGNLFCLRACDADWSIEQYVRAAALKDFNYISTEHLRYGALNPTSLHKYGSLEFRAMRGTANFDTVHKWASILVGIRDSSKMFKDPTSVIENFSDGGEHAFLRMLVGPCAEDLSRLCPDLTSLLRSGVRNAQDVAYASADWGLFNDGVTI